MSDPSGTVPIALPAAVPAHELTRTFGVLLIGFIFSVVLNGLTFFRAYLPPCLSAPSPLHPAHRPETYIYYTRFPSDSFGTKALVSIP